jgi:hypothetical protein
MKSKVHEVNKHIADNSVDIFCLAETFLRGNDKPRDLHVFFFLPLPALRWRRQPFLRPLPLSKSKILYFIEQSPWPCT